MNRYHIRVEVPFFMGGGMVCWVDRDRPVCSALNEALLQDTCPGFGGEVLNGITRVSGMATDVYATAEETYQDWRRLLTGLVINPSGALEAACQSVVRQHHHWKRNADGAWRNKDAAMGETQFAFWYAVVSAPLELGADFFIQARIYAKEYRHTGGNAAELGRHVVVDTLAAGQRAVPMMVGGIQKMSEGRIGGLTEVVEGWLILGAFFANARGGQFNAANPARFRQPYSEQAAHLSERRSVLESRASTFFGTLRNAINERGSVVFGVGSRSRLFGKGGKSVTRVKTADLAAALARHGGNRSRAARDVGLMPGNVCYRIERADLNSPLAPYKEKKRKVGRPSKATDTEIAAALARSGGNQSKAAGELGLDQSTISRRIMAAPPESPLVSYRRK